MGKFTIIKLSIKGVSVTAARFPRDHCQIALRGNIKDQRDAHPKKLLLKLEAIGLIILCTIYSKIKTLVEFNSVEPPQLPEFVVDKQGLNAFATEKFGPFV